MPATDLSALVAEELAIPVAPEVAAMAAAIAARHPSARAVLFYGSCLREKNLDGLEGLSGVAVVGVNVGDLALDDPFDPDHLPYEPHGYVLTIAAEAP